MVIKKCKICEKEFETKTRAIYCGDECRRVGKRNWHHKYDRSERGRDRRRRYNQSEKGRDRQRRYNQSEKGRDRQRRYEFNHIDERLKSSYERKKNKVNNLIIKFDGDIF